MLAKSRFTHPEYGEIEITRNPRARRIILRVRPDALYITLPLRATEKDLAKALDECGGRLKAQQQLMQRPVIDYSFRIDAPLFKFSIEPATRDKFSIRREGERTTLLCPATASLADERRQEWLRKIILNAMRERAKEVLPARLQQLAAMHNLHYTSVSLRNSRTRWGSCSSRGTISLNIHLVLLPQILVDYVLLHELCHTVEMNHSERFWARLDTLVKGDSRSLRKILRGYKCSF